MIGQPSLPGAPATAPAQAEDLLRRISEAFPTLSPQLKTIARYVERHRDSLPLERIQDVALRCEVQPSAVVRFAKRFSLHGFNELKQALREAQRTAHSPSRLLQDRWSRCLARTEAGVHSEVFGLAYLQDAADAVIRLQRELDFSAFDEAVAALLGARSLWIVGTQGDFPVAAYLAHAFQQGAVPVQFLNGLGGMQAGQLRMIGRGDVMIAVDFAPYAEETRAIARAARTGGARVIAITDSLMGPWVAAADTRLLVNHSSGIGAPGIVHRMAVAEGLFIAHAHRQEAIARAAASPAVDAVGRVAN